MGKSPDEMLKLFTDKVDAEVAHENAKRAMTED